MKLRAAVAVAVVSSLFVAAAATAAGLFSSFDSSDEGWYVTTNDMSVPPLTPQAPTHNTAGGNPGGYISVTDQVDESAPGSGRYWFLNSPASWGGNRSSSVGGHLSFDLIVSGTASRGPQASFVDTADNFLFRALAAPAAGTWTHYDVALTPASGWSFFDRSSGQTRAASAADIRGVLASLSRVSILGDIQFGTGDVTGFDNIGLTATSSIRRNLTISYSGGAFRGSVKPQGPCAKSELVKVYRVEKGADPSVGSDRTSGAGRYVEREPKAAGRYYAKVLPSAGPGVKCLVDRSRTIKAG
jgi:hypothetical protein